MRPDRPGAPIRRHRLLRWLGLAALTQLLCAYDTRTEVRDLWLALPEVRRSGADPRSTHRGACRSGSLAGMDLVFRSADASRWEVPHVTTAGLEALARRPIWTKHPITSSEDLHRYDGRFAHVNPSFVRWARTTLMPGVTDSAFRKATQSRYTACLAPAARTMWVVREDLKAAPACKAELVAKYRATITGPPDERYFNASEAWTACTGQGYDTLVDGLAPRVAAPALDGGPQYFDPTFTYALSWWLRREMDGSAAELELGLKALLRAYDGQWLAEHGKPDYRPDPAAVQAAYDQAVADRGSLGGPEATQAAVDRLKQKAGKAKRAELDQRTEAITKACSAYYAELGPRKAKITAAMDAGDEDGVQAAIQDVERWADAQQSPDGPLGRALADAQPLAEAAQEAASMGYLTESQAMGIIAGVAASCGR